MKSLKSVLVVAFACAMLFAFTACENSVPVYRTVDYISLAQVQDVIKGQPFDGSMMNITVHYTDGYSETVSGAGYVLAADGVDTSKAFSVSGSYAGSEPVKYTITPVDPVSAVITAEDVTSIAANPSAPDGATRDVTLGEWSAVISGGTNGSFTVTRATASEYDYTVSAAALVAEEIREAETYEKALTIEYDGTSVATESVVNVIVPPKTVTPDEPAKKDVTSMFVVWTIGGDEEVTSNTATAKAGESVSYEVYGNTENGALKLTENTDYVVTGTIPETASTTSLAASSARISFVAGTENADMVGSVADITITLNVKDVVNSTTIADPTWTYKNHSTSATVIKVGETVTLVPADFTAPDGTYTVNTDTKVPLTCVAIDGNTTVSPTTASPITVNIVYTWVDEDNVTHRVYDSATIQVEQADTGDNV